MQLDFPRAQVVIKGSRATTSVSINARCRGVHTVSTSCQVAYVYLKAKAVVGGFAGLAALREVSSNVTLLVGHKKLYFIIYQKLYSMLWEMGTFAGHLVNFKD